MKRALVLMSAFAATILIGTSPARAQWNFMPSYYSHTPQGDRVLQYSPGETPYIRIDSTYQQSAYIHSETNLRGQHMHTVESWGAGDNIRPYGEWLYPYRPGATPFGPWGNPQGPWTTPGGAFVNPYGLNRLPAQPWAPGQPVPPGYRGQVPGAQAPGAPGAAPGPGAAPQGNNDWSTPMAPPATNP